MAKKKRSCKKKMAPKKKGARKKCVRKKKEEQEPKGFECPNCGNPCYDTPQCPACEAIVGKFVVPDYCGPLADLIFERLKRGEANEEIGDVKQDLQLSVEWLEEIPDEATFADLDILTDNFHWGGQAEVAIRKALKKAGKS